MQADAPRDHDKLEMGAQVAVAPRSVSTMTWGWKETRRLLTYVSLFAVGVWLKALVDGYRGISVQVLLALGFLAFMAVRRIRSWLRQRDDRGSSRRQAERRDR